MRRIAYAANDISLAVGYAKKLMVEPVVPAGIVGGRPGVQRRGTHERVKPRHVGSVHRIRIGICIQVGAPPQPYRILARLQETCSARGSAAACLSSMTGSAPVDMHTMGAAPGRGRLATTFIPPIPPGLYLFGAVGHLFLQPVPRVGHVLNRRPVAQWKTDNQAGSTRISSHDCPIQNPHSRHFPHVWCLLHLSQEGFNLRNFFTNRSTQSVLPQLDTRDNS